VTDKFVVQSKRSVAMNVDEILIINLDKDVEKMEKISKEMNKHGVNFTRIPGILGKTMSIQEIKNETGFVCSYTCPLSAIGCGISHLKAMKHAIDNNNNFTLIFEDDVILVDNFVEKMNKTLENTPNDFDILFLGCSLCNSNNFLTKIYKLLRLSTREEKINEYVKIPSVSLAAHGYIVSLNGAKKIYSLLNKKLLTHVDFNIQLLASKGLITRYSALNQLVYQYSATNVNETNNIPSAVYPALVNKIIPNIMIDDVTSLKYLLNVSLLRIGKINLNIILLMCIVFQWLIYYFCGWKYSIIWFLFVSCLDIYRMTNIKIIILFLFFQYFTF